jgi:dihydrofolate reductase
MNRPHKMFNINAGIMKPLQIVVAVDERGGFAKDGKIPWNHPKDIKRFQEITKGGACVMGRSTYQDMYEMLVTRKLKGEKLDSKKIVKFKEILPGRDSYVLSKTIKCAMGATVSRGLREAVMATDRASIFAIGGERVFAEALPWVEKIHLTIVKGDHGCDRFFPVNILDEDFKIWKGSKASDSLLFIEYIRK